MAEVDGDNTIAFEEMEVESGDIMENTGAPADEPSYNNNDQRKLESDINDKDNTDRKADNMFDTVKEEGEHLMQNSDIPEGMIGKAIVSEETDSAGQLRKNPAAVIVGQNHKFTVRSRYLRASTGSCHDFCKYGHKHETQKKTKRPSLGTIREARPLMRTASGDNLAKANSVLGKETGNKPLLRRLSLPGPIPEKEPPNHPGDSSKNVTPNPSKLKRIKSEIKPSPVPTPGHSHSRSKIDISSGKNTAVQSSNSQEKSSLKGKEIKTKKDADSYSKGENEKAKEPTSSSPKTPLKKSPSIKAKLYKNLKSFSRSRFQSNSEVGKTNGSGDVPEKSVNVVADSTPAKKASKLFGSSKVTPNTSGVFRAGKSKGSKSNRKGTQIGLSSSSSASASTSAALKAQEASEPQGENQQKLDSTKTKKIGTIAKGGGSKTNTPRARTTLDQRTKVKRTSASHPEEKDGSAWKVKFRRGTVVNLQVASNSPRKLRFKRGKILGEDQIAKPEADKSLKNTDDFAKKSPDAEPESGKVRLRRQEAASKKDNVDMNDVIEETASKLVKTRKSKVKALVGAFETVMSFRDRKPLVETSAS